MHFVHRQTVIVDERAVALDDGDDPGVVLFLEDLAGEIADVPKPLQRDSFPAQAAAETRGRRVLRMAEELA